jgi:hypothetical protein
VESRVSKTAKRGAPRLWLLVLLQRILHSITRRVDTPIPDADVPAFSVLLTNSSARGMWPVRTAHDGHRLHREYAAARHDHMGLSTPIKRSLLIAPIVHKMAVLADSVSADISFRVRRDPCWRVRTSDDSLRARCGPRLFGDPVRLRQLPLLPCAGVEVAISRDF